MGIEDVICYEKHTVKKIFYNGQVCILRDGKVYDIMGNQIQ